ncbi:insulin-induced protein-domain-containing protein [Xylariales sp. PMI_506]|nr:insulin-induced protein-domain-containing protein [Xylariales sp. PMI_506]
MDDQSSPPILRPIPRRPFNLQFTGPTPPDADDENASPVQPMPSRSFDRNPGALNLDSLNRRLLDPRVSTPTRYDSNSGSNTISRAESLMNLTSSTLFGIYAPSQTYGRDRYDQDDEPTTPWGTGAETPGKNLNADEPNYEIQKERSRRSSHLRRRSSIHMPPPSPLSTVAALFYLGFRTLMLFGLGVLYGALVARFRDGQNKLTGQKVDEALMTRDPGYMMFWGVSGVALGVLLPWFDGVWEGVFGEEEVDEPTEYAVLEDEDAENRRGTDWTLVMRGVGAFVGICFAIRKLPWDSTLQVSLALALVNPFLWYLIDRSKAGFLLAATVGLTGTAVLMGFQTDMIPTPAAGQAASAVRYNVTTKDPLHVERVFLGGLATQQTLETGIWMLSVLFCCCICFGNIGRRLALNRLAERSIRGRWAERKVG